MMQEENSATQHYQPADKRFLKIFLNFTEITWQKNDIIAK